MHESAELERLRVENQQLRSRLAAQSDGAVSEAADAARRARVIIREFIVHAAGFDAGEAMTAQAEELRRELAAAGVLLGGIYEPTPLNNA
jgi:hypothetical protein